MSQPLKLKVELIDQAHEVNRSLLVPYDINMVQLHLIIQDAFGWLNAHLFDFRDQRFNAHFSVEIPDANPDTSDLKNYDAFKTSLKDLFFEKNKAEHFWYTYDFEDNWEHKISFLEPDKDDLNKFEGFPKCTEAVGACPPEDIGGAIGYTDFLKTINDKNHPDYNKLRRWMEIKPGEYYDTTKVNLKSINIILKDLYDSDEFWEEDSSNVFGF